MSVYNQNERGNEMEVYDSLPLEYRKLIGELGLNAFDVKADLEIGYTVEQVKENRYAYA